MRTRKEGVTSAKKRNVETKDTAYEGRSSPASFPSDSVRADSNGYRYAIAHDEPEWLNDLRKVCLLQHLFHREIVQVSFPRSLLRTISAGRRGLVFSCLCVECCESHLRGGFARRCNPLRFASSPTRCLRRLRTLMMNRMFGTRGLHLRRSTLVDFLGHGLPVYAVFAARSPARWSAPVA